MMRADRPSIAVAHFRKAIELEPWAKDSIRELELAEEALALSPEATKDR
jgi:hypothetical protein